MRGLIRPSACQHPAHFRLTDEEHRQVNSAELQEAPVASPSSCGGFIPHSKCLAAKLPKRSAAGEVGLCVEGVVTAAWVERNR